MEASVYEDVLRTLLGTNAYILFTLHKIISQLLKQLQMILVEDFRQAARALPVRAQARLGSIRGTYRNNARFLLEGDDCFMEQMYNGEGMAIWCSPSCRRRTSTRRRARRRTRRTSRTTRTSRWASRPSGRPTWTRSSPCRPPAPPRGLVLPRTLRAGSKRARRLASSIRVNGLECRAVVTGGCRLTYIKGSKTSGSARAARRRSAPQAAAALLQLARAAAKGFGVQRACGPAARRGLKPLSVWGARLAARASASAGPLPRASSAPPC